MRKRAALAPFCLLAISLIGCSGNGTVAASISAAPGTLTFTATTVGQTTTAQTVTVTDTGGLDAKLATPTISGPNASDFVISANTCTSTLAASANCGISITFTPSANGARAATLTIAGNANTQTVALTGTGNSLANVSVSPAAFTFASAPINQTAAAQSITVTNTGGTSATLGNPALIGANFTDFAISSASTCTNTIAANATCTIAITFTPTAAGPRSATLTLGESSLGVANNYTAGLTGTGAAADLGLEGTVISGAQPIANATVQLYKVGANGNGSAATAMLANTVTTNNAGNFYLATGSPLALSFTCANASDQVYAVATGGNPGLTPDTTNNAALVMMTALGNCGALTTASTIAINELTTAAAAWALAPFMTSATNVGASATNSAGMANAMLHAQQLANSSTGFAATLPSNLTVEPGKLAALADALGSCANSDGATACAPLFSAATPTGGTAPNNTLTAVWNIVQHPGQNPAAVFALIPATPLYATTLTAPPNDWTITLAVTGGGLASPEALDSDSSGNIWVADYNGAVSAFTPQGTPLSATGFGIGSTSEIYGLTIDTSGNIWVSNQVGPTNNAGSVTELVPNGASGIATTTNYFDASINFPVALSADTNGDIFIANYAGASGVTAYTSAGAPLATHGTGLGGSVTSGPVAVAADNAHGVWIANSECVSLATCTVTHVSATGAVLSNLTCCAGINGSNGIATDSAGNAWVSDYGADAISVIATSPSGDSILTNESPLLGSGFTSNPAGVSVDAAQNVWVANYRGKSITELAGIHSDLTLATMLSPAAGFGYSAAATPTIAAPAAVIPDASGSLWVSDNGNNDLVMFFGLATPTKTPVQPTPVAP
jgi:hypothetical protein